jgi:hypothetical protein
MTSDVVRKEGCRKIMDGWITKGKICAKSARKARNDKKMIDSFDSFRAYYLYFVRVLVLVSVVCRRRLRSALFLLLICSLLQ